MFLCETKVDDNKMEMVKKSLGYSEKLAISVNEKLVVFVYYGLTLCS